MPFQNPNNIVETAGKQNITDIITTASDLMVTLLGVVAGFALCLFFLGVVKVLSSHDDQEALKKWRSAVLWGIIGFTVFLSLGAILAIIQRTFFGGIL